MSRKYQKGAEPLTDYDLFLARQFCKDELMKYLRPMREFWAHASAYAERPPGDYSSFDSEFSDSAGYHIERRRLKHSPFRNIAAYPYVKASRLKVFPSASSRMALRRVFDDPIRVEEFYCLLKGDSYVVYLTEAAYASTLSSRTVETSVLLGREEAYAILAGETLERTKGKLKRAFDMEEGEWEGETFL